MPESADSIHIGIAGCISRFRYSVIRQILSIRHSRAPTKIRPFGATLQPILYAGGISSGACCKNPYTVCAVPVRTGITASIKLLFRIINKRARRSLSTATFHIAAVCRGAKHAQRSINPAGKRTPLRKGMLADGIGNSINLTPALSIAHLRKLSGRIDSNHNYSHYHSDYGNNEQKLYECKAATGLGSFAAKHVGIILL